jgi:hypothetical protein
MAITEKVIFELPWSAPQVSFVDLFSSFLCKILFRVPFTNGFVVISTAQERSSHPCAKDIVQVQEDFDALNVFILSEDP